MTFEEFLNWPGDGRAKHYELADGRVLALPPKSPISGLLQVRLGSMIRDRLDASGSAARIVAKALVQPCLPSKHNARVSDLCVTSATIRLGQIVVDQPLLLVEVLSSEAAEAWSRASIFTTIPSLREIAIVQSQRVEIQVLRCSDDRIWPHRPETVTAGGTMRLESIGLACPIGEIYSDTPLG